MWQRALNALTPSVSFDRSRTAAQLFGRETVSIRQTLIALLFAIPATFIAGLPEVASAQSIASIGDPDASLLDSAPLSAQGNSESEKAVIVPVATDSRVSGDWKRTRFIVDLTDSVPIRAFALGSPYRVIVDLPEVAFRLPPNRGQESRGLISAYRFGLFAPGKSRIVLDVAKPVRIDRAFVLKAEDGQPARLVVDLIETDTQTFNTVVAANASAQQSFPQSNTSSKSPRLNIVPAPRPDISKPAEKPRIVIDAGHGGVDPGAIGRSGLQEKQITLEFAKTLEKVLEETGQFDVVMTRRDDTFIPLNDRVRIAREAGASLFISVHADSFRTGSVRGATVYTVSDKASDAAAAALAESENNADSIAGLSTVDEDTSVNDILVDLMRRETKNLSILFARTAIDELRLVTRMNKNPHRFAGFRVLRAPDVPSVLLEIGYMTNPDDVRRMQDPKWRNDTATSLAQAARRFLGPQLQGAAQGG